MRVRCQSTAQPRCPQTTEYAGALNRIGDYTLIGDCRERPHGVGEGGATAFMAGGDGTWVPVPDWSIMRRPRIVHETEVQPTSVQGFSADVRTLIDPASGSQRVLQRIFRIPADAGCLLGTPWADDLLYVCAGTGQLSKPFVSERHDLEMGTAFSVPSKTPVVATGTSRRDLVLVSVAPPPQPDLGYTMEARNGPIRILRESEQPSEPAGEDRHFKVLLQTDVMTQFVGFIRRSKAPPHTHTYEEAIYIVDGEGIAHVEDRPEPIRTGSSVFLPPGTPHCLENRGERTLKLLGVFSPPGSPAGRRDVDPAA
jgi:mannose-6-phosphate isomerase-like protein (cupin superfamily)